MYISNWNTGYSNTVLMCTWKLCHHKKTVSFTHWSVTSYAKHSMKIFSYILCLQYSNGQIWHKTNQTHFRHHILKFPALIYTTCSTQHIIIHSLYLVKPQQRENSEKQNCLLVICGRVVLVCFQKYSLHWNRKLLYVCKNVQLSLSRSS